MQCLNWKKQKKWDKRLYNKKSWKIFFCIFKFFNAQKGRNFQNNPSKHALGTTNIFKTSQTLCSAIFSVTLISAWYKLSLRNKFESHLCEILKVGSEKTDVFWNFQNVKKSKHFVGNSTKNVFLSWMVLLKHSHTSLEWATLRVQFKNMFSIYQFKHFGALFQCVFVFFIFFVFFHLLACNFIIFKNKWIVRLCCMCKSCLICSKIVSRFQISLFVPHKDQKNTKNIFGLNWTILNNFARNFF